MPKRAKKAKPATKAGRTKKLVRKPKTDRANKKAEVIAMLKRAKGATLAECLVFLGITGGKSRDAQPGMASTAWH